MNFKDTEKRILDFWEKNKIYKYSYKGKGKIYSVDTPPPTVSGNMHIGHAFSYAQEDFIARFRRMKGENVFYPFGTDDNGLPTERLVEKLNNVKSKEMSRKEFIDLCLKTLKKITPDFVQDWKNLGISCDYDVYYSTIDDNSRKISQKSFIELYRKGLVYKKEFPTIWCPECQTSIAQAELEDKELLSSFSTIKFKIKNSKENISIATTRPELLGACVAIFVNPEDKRYKKFIGEKVIVPIFNQEVAIIGDSSADVEKGTGVMMVCSYGDKYDVDAVQRYKLNPKIIFNKDGTLNSKKYNGLKIKEARKNILEDLKKENLLVESNPIKHIVNVHDKCGTGIEFLPTEQWFIKILDKKKIWIAQGKKINWYPKFMRKRYENWVNGLEWDWNISRNRHFGIPIPVWECKKCNVMIFPKESELPIDPLQIKKRCSKCNEIATPEDKVLDTWATSSLTPRLTSSIVKGSVKIPYSLRPQGHDIIRTWAFYTIVKFYLHEKKIPWQDIIISGFVTLGKEKMSKSKGNIIEPQVVMNKYGADALRFWAAGSKLGEDLNYQEKDLVTGKKFVNKLVNASKFVFMNLEGFNGTKPRKLQLVDEIFLAKVRWNVYEITKNFKRYEYSKAKQKIENLFWRDFCDNYLEIVKKRIYQGNKEERISAQYSLYQSLLTILKLIAPIMPFITEEIYQTYFEKFEKEKSIHLSKWPESKLGQKGLDNLPRFTNMIDIISKIRKEKTKVKKPMNSEIILTLTKGEQAALIGMIEDLKAVTNAKEIKTGKFKVEFI